jgi:Protein of unknown function (DUF2510)
MAGPSSERRYSASADEVFAAAERATDALGYTVLERDSELRTLSFDTGPRAAFGADQPISVQVVPDGAGSRVVMTGSLVRSMLASRGRLMWNGDGLLSNRFLDALTRDLLAPPAGWLEDPSRRFAQRWWDGSAWTAAARDRDLGVRYEDPPGALPPPWSLQTVAPGPGPTAPSRAASNPDRPTSTSPPLAWRATRVAGA